MKTLVITVVVLIAALVAADYGVAAAAEYQVSKRAREQFKLAQDPAVRINGFPFLLQAVEGDYRDITVTADSVAFSNLRNVTIQADMHHARVALSDLVSGSARSLTVDDVQGSVKVRANDVGRILNIPDLAIEPAPQDVTATAGGATAAQAVGVKLTGSKDIAGMITKFTVLATLSLVKGEIQVTPNKLDASNSQLARLPESVQRSLLSGFNFPIHLGALPFSATPTAVHAESGALVVEGTAKHVVIGGGGGGQ